jgi:hypothetical protein
MKTTLTLLLLILSFTMFAQTQFVRTDEMTLHTNVQFDEESKLYSIENEVGTFGQIIDTLYLTANDTIVDTIQSLKNLKPGNYRARFTDNMGNTIENIGWILIDGHELEELKPKLVKVYPNPMRQFMVVEYDVPIRQDFSITIVNTENGQTVASTQIDPYNRKVIIKTNNLQRGKYMVCLIDGTGVIARKKTIKLKNNS